MLCKSFKRDVRALLHDAVHDEYIHKLRSHLSLVICCIWEDCEHFCNEGIHNGRRLEVGSHQQLGAHLSFEVLCKRCLILGQPKLLYKLLCMYKTSGSRRQVKEIL